MIKKRYLTLGIIGICFYSLFFYEPDINESDAKKFMAIEVNDDDVDIDFGKVIKVKVDNDGEHETASVDIADALKVRSDGDEGAVNLLGMGSDIDENDTETITNENGVNNSEVSIKSNNPMIFRAGNTSKHENQIYVDGIGIGELYELDGHDLHVNGIKNLIKVKGTCGHITVDGIASIVRVDGASSVTVNGIGNRVYVDGVMISDMVSKDGILNFVYHEDQ